MTKKTLLWTLCVFFCFAGSAWADEATAVAEQAEAPVAVEQAAGEAVVEAPVEAPAEVIVEPFWLTLASENCNEFEGSGSAQLSPGGCNTNISCSSHLTCMQRCPFGVGACTLANCCLCAT